MSKIDINLSKEKYKDIASPQGLDNAIQRGREKALRERKLRYKRPMWGLVASILGFVILLNTSVAFAKVMSKVPLIRDFANVVLINPGIKYALEEGYIQEINKVYEIDGVKVTLTRIIGDNKRLIFGYIIEGVEEKEGQYISPRNIEIASENDKQLEIFETHGPGDYSSDGLKPLMNEKYFEVGLGGEDSIPKRIKVVFDKIIDMNNPDREQILSQGKFIMDIEIKDKILQVKPQVYPLNKEVDLDGFRVFIREMRVYPMGTEVVIRRDIGKAQRFTWLKDGYLEDEKENIFRLVSGGTKNGDEYILTFAGGAYNKSKHFTLKARGMIYQPRIDREVVIDKSTGRLIEDGGYGLDLLSIENKGEETQINFKPKEGANIESIDLTLIGGSKFYSQFWHNYEGNDDRYIKEFGVTVDSTSVKADILKFAVTWIHKFQTSSFEIELK